MLTLNEPELDPQCMEEFHKFNKQGGSMAVIYRLDDSDNTIRVEKVIPEGSPYEQFLSQFPEQDIRWAVLNFRYMTNSGGKRCKVTWISYVPDTLRRKTHKETVRVKSSGVMMAGPLRRAIGPDAISSSIQANGLYDLDGWEVLKKVSRFERDNIDNSSVETFFQGSLQSC